MEFKQEALVEREIEIAAYLLSDLSFKLIAEKTGLSKKLLSAHVGNMMEKLKVDNTTELLKVLGAIELER
ncbi:MAG: LuxR C-terminal-related transcriptional regulator [Chitinophagaceae bacterium]